MQSEGTQSKILCMILHLSKLPTLSILHFHYS